MFRLLYLFIALFVVGLVTFLLVSVATVVVNTFNRTIISSAESALVGLPSYTITAGNITQVGNISQQQVTSTFDILAPVTGVVAHDVDIGLTIAFIASIIAIFIFSRRR